ncbi:glycoside hydrolase superfamily [Phascolomyces articulosus]|uniref:mannan endo-1,4-beta-mannosidase n=1 Tax=Phascolomyces articulosus TaxID=60185 RepID=A0AAD5KKC9_9FUNG|nr:glycoside hydrolase superfamily [Phascolomyces articulosus]
MKLLTLALALTLTLTGRDISEAAPHHGHDSAGYVKVAEDGKGFTRNGEPYLIRGANYWQGMNLGADECSGGDRHRLEKEMKLLVNMGINNLRVMASVEGPDDQPVRIRPSLMYAPGEYNEGVFQGLDYLLDAMGRHGLTAVMTLNNYWQWSGGFAQYVAWIDKNQTAYPFPSENEGWDEFTKYSARFYNDTEIYEEAQSMWRKHIETVISRRNTINGKIYRDDPVIMSWQLANEPQEGPLSWFEETSAFIKDLAPNHLVSAGLESKLDQYDFNRAHTPKDIDYTTCHLWVENWEIYDPSNESSIEDAMTYADDYVHSRAQWAAELNKPIVMEEFGMARDAWIKPGDEDFKYDPETPTAHKDRYYKGIFDNIVTLAKKGQFSGSNFWAYAGLGRATDYPNQYGMVWVADPPHEKRGWYSVYDKDTTVKVIEDYNAQLKALEEK